MRTHINNKVYDTSTAKQIFLVANEYSKNDLRYQEIGVFKKQTGEYFLYQFMAQRGIISPLSYAKAKEFTGIYGSNEEYNKEFGLVVDTTTVSSRFDLPLDVKKKLEILASNRGQSRTQVLIDLIRSV